MKIIHVYSQNLSVFEQALEGTGYCLNGSKDITYLMHSLSSYNARDVLGLIVFQKHITRRTLKLIKAFDDFFLFKPMSIIVICDEATELADTNKIRVKHSNLFVINSIDGTISDVDIKRVFTTLVCTADEMYQLRDVECANSLQSKNAVRDTGIVPRKEEYQQVLDRTNEVIEILKELGG